MACDTPSAVKRASLPVTARKARKTRPTAAKMFISRIHIDAMRARAEGGENFMGDGARRFRHLFERDGVAEKFDLRATHEQRGGHIARVEREQIHGNASGEGNIEPTDDGSS